MCKPFGSSGRGQRRTGIRSDILPRLDLVVPGDRAHRVINRGIFLQQPPLMGAAAHACILLGHILRAINAHGLAFVTVRHLAAVPEEDLLVGRSRVDGGPLAVFRPRSVNRAAQEWNSVSSHSMRPEAGRGLLAGAAPPPPRRQSRARRSPRPPPGARPARSGRGHGGKSASFPSSRGCGAWTVIDFDAVGAGHDLDDGGATVLVLHVETRRAPRGAPLRPRSRDRNRWRATSPRSDGTGEALRFGSSDSTRTTATSRPRREVRVITCSGRLAHRDAAE